MQSEKTVTINFLDVIVFGSAGIYAGFIVYFLIGLRKLEKEQRPSNNGKPGISVVIAARNEEAHIKKTVLSLNAQNYPANRFEIIVVNDRSTDGTAEILEQLSAEIKNLRIVTVTQLPTGISPKKQALQFAVQQSRFDWIMTTDADCLLSPDCLSSYAGLVSDDLGVACGLTLFHLDRYRGCFEKNWQMMQNIEFVSEQLVSAGAIGHNTGYSANGANMLFRKELYHHRAEDSVKKNIVSGDDFFLIQAAHRLGYRLKFNLHPASVVKSLPVRTLRGLINQRARWGSKVGMASRPVLLFSINTFVYYSAISVAGVLMFFVPALIPRFLILWGLKFIVDTVYVSHGYKVLGLRLAPFSYLLTALLHAPFIVFCVLVGNLFGFRWKGERYRALA
jgi:biofilm PGA synthesis N-glycosyltransferase PgaC